QFVFFFSSRRRHTRFSRDWSSDVCSSDGDTCWPSQVDDQVSPLSSEQEAISSQLASLTPQQFRVLSMVCDGLLNKQIAYELQVSEATVKAHVTAIFRKLGVRTRTQAALALQQMELSRS